MPGTRVLVPPQPVTLLTLVMAKVANGGKVSDNDDDYHDKNYQDDNDHNDDRS